MQPVDFTIKGSNNDEKYKHKCTAATYKIYTCSLIN